MNIVDEEFEAESRKSQHNINSLLSFEELEDIFNSKKDKDNNHVELDL